MKGLHNLDRVISNRKKRLGRGLGSGKGKTGGRGTKGQKARGSIPASFIGGSLPLYKKLPFRRGLGNRKVSAEPIPVPSGKLNKLPGGSVVDYETLVRYGIVSLSEVSKKGVKVLGQGELSVVLEVKVPVSGKARGLIEKAGGKVV